jgi:hypothetical protein
MAHSARCSESTSRRCRSSCEGKRHGEANVQVGGTQSPAHQAQTELPGVATVIARVREFADRIGVPMEVWERARGRWTQVTEGEG